MAAQTVKATTLARVKSIAKIGGTQSDVELQSILNAVSKEIEDYLDREFEIQAYTEEHSFKSGERSVWLRALPVASVATVKRSLDWDFTNADEIEDTDRHFEPKTGRLFIARRVVHSVTFNPDGFNSLEVVYTGGMAVDTDALILDFPDVALAADYQIGEDFRRKHSLGTSSRPGPAGGDTYEGRSRFLPRVQELLAGELRRVFQ